MALEVAPANTWRTCSPRTTYDEVEPMRASPRCPAFRRWCDTRLRASSSGFCGRSVGHVLRRQVYCRRVTDNMPGDFRLNRLRG